MVVMVVMVVIPLKPNTHKAFSYHHFILQSVVMVVICEH